LLAGDDGPVLIVAGDCPLMQGESITTLMERFEQQRPACLLGTAYKDDPEGLGRIVRDAEGNFLAIVEHKDASPQQRDIKEVNMSYYVFAAGDLLYALERIEADNAQGEYYVTDCPGVLKAAGRQVQALPVLKPIEALSINTADELAAVEAAMHAELEK
jgi:bifunctional UDP-N-acetylglucosamine pyrophosphorylase/glucosamine-1-phosphate N-acetyltransferase/UDP-N-acetylglucosamine pyrophosphorylase